MGIGNVIRRVRGLPPRSKDYGKDIDLPLEEGQRRDPRLPPKGGVMGSLRQAGKGYKLLREKGLVGSRSSSKR